MRYIKSTSEFADSFCVGVAGESRSYVPRVLHSEMAACLAYPDGHPDADINEETELDHLKAKIDAGAEFIVTQLFYDVDGFLSWLKRVRSKGRPSRTKHIVSLIIMISSFQV